MSKYLPQSQITLLAFKGTQKLHIFDRRDVRDDLLTQFNEAIGFLKKHLNVRSEIKGVNRQDIYEIPFEAIREAVVNALMHRDYSITGTQVNIEVYDDRLEIINPGGLPHGLSKKAFGNISMRRNELISDLFFRLHKVERIGMGIKRIRQAIIAAGLKEPDFDTDGLFRVVFYRPDKILFEGEQAPTQKTTQKILDMIKQDPVITRQKLADKIGISTDGIKYHLKQLQQKDVIRRVGPDKGGYWEIVQ